MSLINFVKRIPCILFLTVIFIREVIKSSIEVSFYSLKPDLDITPGIIAYPLKLKKDYEINLLANLITMTPGTTSMDVSSDKKTLYVYGINVKDRESFCEGIKTSFEENIKGIFG